MSLRPLHDRVVVKRIEANQQTPGGILIPDAAAEKPDQGEVLAVGEGRRLDSGTVVPMAVRVGDKVLFGKYSGQTVKLETEEFLIMKEEDILGVVK